MNNKRGWIEVVCGPMFAGKSEELIRRARRLGYAKKKYLVFKPSIDNRYSESEVVSHDKRRLNSIASTSTQKVRDYLKDEDLNKIDAIIFDEVQFFDNDIIALIEELADVGIRVICGGLDMDFKGDPFYVTANLLARAEKVDKLTAICVKCGENATRSQRLINGEPASANSSVVLIGGQESYEPRCRKCHVVK
jgi:thymidine kinase